MIMLLKQLVIKGLHDNYDYDVKFNDDVTFIYGMNGCGKTTVLNITEAIITGRVYRLFDYQFSSISLKYTDGDDSNSELIEISRSDNELTISFKGEEATIEMLTFSEREQMRTAETASEYFARYNILDNIRNAFNHVYLPLNRLNYSETPNELLRMIRNRISHYGFEALPEVFSHERDYVILNIQRLIKDKYTRIMSQISDYNTGFRNEILKSLLTIKTNDNNPLLNAISGIAQKEIDDNEIIHISDSYIKILRQLDIITPDEEKTYREPFIDFLNEYNKWKKKKNAGLPSILASQYTEILRLIELVRIAEANEMKKREAFDPVDTFVDTINEFISNEMDKKEIQISTKGEIYFTIVEDREKKIGIEHLSSGEKQLVVFFATLVFEIQKDSTGIFIMDEPELSLHLTWQKKFVERALSLNSNIQLIFATHSPEIVGKYRKKMFELIKKPCVKENKNDE